MKAFVTGCAGFIGSTLVDRLLDQGYRVIGIDCFTDYYSRAIKTDNISSAMTKPNFELIEDDLLQMDQYPVVDYVFHEAAQAGVRASWGNSFTTYTKNNIEATQKLLEFYRSAGIKKFVYASSSSVYGNTALPNREDNLLKPVSPYGVSKLAAEHLCYLYWKNYAVPTVALRYFTVYGPRQRPDMGIHKFIRSVIKGDPIYIYGDGKQTRDFTFVDDIVNANILAAKSDITGEVFNIGGGNRISVDDLISKIEKILDVSSNKFYIESQKGDVDNTWADVTKANRLLGWRSKVAIDEGLQREADWIKRQIVLAESKNIPVTPMLRI